MFSVKSLISSVEPRRESVLTARALILQTIPDRYDCSSVAWSRGSATVRADHREQCLIGSLLYVGLQATNSAGFCGFHGCSPLVADDTKAATAVPATVAADTAAA